MDEDDKDAEVSDENRVIQKSQLVFHFITKHSQLDGFTFSRTEIAEKAMPRTKVL